MKNTELLKNIIFFSISSFIICLPSLYNGYPIMYFDSGNYIAQSVSLEAGDLNPIGYPLFVRAFSWRFSLWPVVFAQGLLPFYHRRYPLSMHRDRLVCLFNNG